VKIIFEGTIKEWSSISKLNRWNYNTGEYSVSCTDGILPKVGEVIYDSNGLVYTVNDDGESCTLSGIGTYTKSTVTIPNTVNEYTVTGIGSYAFSNCSFIAKIVIPESVMSIGEGAFSNCTILQSINLPKVLTTIEPRTFRGCRALCEIEIPSKVTSIGESAFTSCAFQTVTIPNGVKTIGAEAFSSCKYLTSVYIPYSVTLIESYAFYGCSSLQTVNVGQVYNNWWIASYDKNATSGSSMGKFDNPSDTARVLTEDPWYSMNLIRR
jgi:hypothetical protein